MINLIKEYIKENNLLDDNETIVLAVSGGIDSMVLFSMLKRLNYNVVVAHVNHNVRQESADELKFVKEYAHINNSPFESIVLPDINEGNFHEVARNMRYQFFFNVADKYHTNKIITAHHADDLFETVLMRLIRGSNLYGYGGIKPISRQNNYLIVRPMLCLNRHQINCYQKEFNIPFKEDCSNASDKYTRNRFRHHVIPKITAENDEAYTNVIHFSNMIYEAFDYIRNNTIKLYNRWQNKIDNKEFIALDSALAHDYINYLLEQNNLPMNYKKIIQIDNFIKSSLPNASFTLSDSICLRKQYDYTILENNYSLIDYEFLIDSFGTYNLPNGDIVKIKRNIENNEEIYLKLCYNTTRLPFKVRNRRSGDYFNFPYGKKKIKKLFIDMKIPMDIRDTVPIVLDAKDNILGIPGIIKGPKNVADPLYIVYERRNNNGK